MLSTQHRLSWLSMGSRFRGDDGSEAGGEGKAGRKRHHPLLRLLARFFVAALLSLPLAFCDASAADVPALKGGVFAPPRAAPEIALPASTGKPFRLSAYRGKVVVLEFGYTNCADVCPVSLAALAQARKLLGPAAADVQVLFITVDPARDSAALLRTYLANFDPTFIGISGSEAQIAALLASYGISATKRMMDGSKTEYTMHHSSYLYFIDRQGMQRSLMPFGRPAADIAHDLTLLLKK